MCIRDSHKGSWGNANDARNVIYADSLTEEGLFDAIRDRRLYATEDKNLEISYTLDGHMMGSQLGTEEVGENVTIDVTVYDPDHSDAISKVEVVEMCIRDRTSPASLTRPRSSVSCPPPSPPNWTTRSRTS